MDFTTLLAILGLSTAPAADKLFTTGMTLQEVLATTPAPVVAPAAPTAAIPSPPVPLNAVLTYSQSANQDLPSRWADYQGKKIDISAIIEREAQKNDIDPLLIELIIKQESRFQVDAESWVGAGGLMQLMPETAADLGCDDAFNPEQNVAAGTRYIANQYRYYGDVDLALAAYNAGPGNVDNYGGVPPFEETQHYVEVIGGEYRATRAQL